MTQARAVCPVCGAHYAPGGKYTRWDVVEYLTDLGFGITFDDLIGHSRALALIARNLRMDTEGITVYPPMRALLRAILLAKRFIHFTSIGLSPVVLGALKLAAQTVDVRGVVSGVREPMARELTAYKDEAPNLEIRLFDYPTDPEGWERIPHQKITVIDGLLAFKGSADLTASAWRRAAEGRDIIEAVTDIHQVIELHNRFFSPIWTEFSDVRIVRMGEEPPAST